MDIAEMQSRLAAPTETTNFDAKAAMEFDPSTPAGLDAVMEIVRDMAAMANSGGGVIVLGVDEPPSGLVISGMTSAQIASWDPTLLGDQVRSKIQPSVRFELKRFSVGAFELLAIDVSSFGHVPHVCASGYQLQASGIRNKQHLVAGRFYFRSSSAETTYVKDYQDSVQLFESVLHKRQEEYLTANEDKFAGKACLLIRDIGGTTSYSGESVTTELNIQNLGRGTARNATVQFSKKDGTPIGMIHQSRPIDFQPDQQRHYGFRIGRPRDENDTTILVVSMQWTDERGSDRATYEVEYQARGDQWHRIIHHETAQLGTTCSVHASFVEAATP